jgi:hypothetical protein
MSKLLRIAALAAVVAAGSAQNRAEAKMPNNATGVRAAIEDLATIGLIHCTPGIPHWHRGGMFGRPTDGCHYQFVPPRIVPNTRARWPFEGQPTVVRVPRRTCHVYGQSRVRPC